MSIKVLGRRPEGERLQRIVQSNNYRDGSFQNIEPTELIIGKASYWRMMKDFYQKPSTVSPSRPLPVIRTQLKSLVAEKPTIVWFGHSSYFLQQGTFRMLVDPVFSGYASPVSFLAKAFKGTNVFNADEIPDLELLLITHDHYDHLDYDTFKKIHARAKKIVCPLGVGEHLIYWGAEADKIIEMDWWEKISLGSNASLTATPARHFSGRGLKRGQSLWASFVLEFHHHRLFLGGDSGYDQQFARIGKEFGPFDLAVLESGQYGDKWPYIHMRPEETVQAAVDLQAKVLLPVHWGKFCLAMHPWNEPINRVLAAAQQLQVNVTSPKIGEPYSIGDACKENKWWDVE